jgi:hypothetical protein
MAIIMKRSDLEDEDPPETELDFAIRCLSLSVRPHRVPDHFIEDGTGDAAPTNGVEELSNTGVT